MNFVVGVLTYFVAATIGRQLVEHGVGDPFWVGWWSASLAIYALWMLADHRRASQ